VAGANDPEQLAHAAQGSLVKKQKQLKAALTGKLTAHTRPLLRELLQLLANLDHSLDHLDREIAERLRPYNAPIERKEWSARAASMNPCAARSCGLMKRAGTASGVSSAPDWGRVTPPLDRCTPCRTTLMRIS
jgi:hypothetical protein